MPCVADVFHARLPSDSGILLDDWNGVYRVGTLVVRDLLQFEDDPTFSIYADETVPVKEVVALMNIAKRNHYKVIMATSPE